MEEKSTKIAFFLQIEKQTFTLRLQASKSATPVAKYVINCLKLELLRYLLPIPRTKLRYYDPWVVWY